MALPPLPRDGFPAHAGMDPLYGIRPLFHSRLPRTRGDGPEDIEAVDVAVAASPHTRGWTPMSIYYRRPTDGFPAHAGMDPSDRLSGTAIRWLPRTRGDGPRCRVILGISTRASPHTRGWTLRFRRLDRLRDGFPAHAGMDP